MRGFSHSSPQKNTGFTLIEVIASFTILSMTFMVVLEILSNSSANTIKSSSRTQIALLAQSKMDEVGILIPIEEGSVAGDFDDEKSWFINIQPYEVQYEGNVDMNFVPVELFKVQLDITWPDGHGQPRTSTFTTLKAMSPNFEYESGDQ